MTPKNGNLITLVPFPPYQPWLDIETIALMQAPQGGGGFTPKFRKTLSMYGSGVGKRQGQAA